MARTLTSANSVIMLQIEGLFTVPQQLQGFSADAIFDTETVNNAELSMGVDGKLSAGWVPAQIVQNITLQADSPSIDVFEAWYQAEQQKREKYPANAVFRQPSVGKTYTGVRGFLTGYVPIGSATRTLQPRRFTITWESVSGAPI